MKSRRDRRQAMAAMADSQQGTPEVAIATAFQYGIYGIAIWDLHFNLIAANRQYADLHKIPSTLLTPGSSLRSIMHNLKVRGVLSTDTDPDALMEIIQSTLAETGQLTSYIRFSDDTILEISAERASNGDTVAYLRNATRDKMLTNKAREAQKKAEAYSNAIAQFPLRATKTSSTDYPQEIDQITHCVASLLEVDWCVVWARSAILNEATAASAYQRATDQHIKIENLVLPDLGAYLAVLETSRVIAIDDLDKHAFGQAHGNRAPLDEYAYASIDTPFRRNGRIMGVLSCIDTKGARSWTATDKMFVMSAVSHIGNLMSTSDQSNLWELPTGEIYTGRQAAE
ncbi:PAS-domain containing protein [Parvibaculaceae bacterium PLY_AMNH_Bact1]|nr:PAS-domain containing protein [Parvibaculaceae bacterium PLY_AMNH_Bact1]